MIKSGTVKFGDLRANLQEFELMARLQQVFGLEEATSIVNYARVNPVGYASEDHGLLVLYSRVGMNYMVVVGDDKYRAIINDLPFELSDTMPINLHTEMEKVKLYDGCKIEPADIDYILNCKLISEQKEENGIRDTTHASLIWRLAKSLLISDRILRKKSKEEEIQKEIEVVDSMPDEEPEVKVININDGSVMVSTNKIKHAVEEQVKTMGLDFNEYQGE